MSAVPTSRFALPSRVLGALVVLAGLVLTAVPTLVHDPGLAPDLFEATERHVRWGLAVGVGLLLIAQPWRRPWSVVFAWIALCGSGGYLASRLIGIAIEGPGSAMQWLWTGVELIICAVAAAWIHRRRGAPDRAGRSDAA